MDIKRWHIWQGVVVEDLVKRSFVVAAQEDIVMRDLREFLIHAPVEHDGGTGIKFVIELLRLFCIRQKFIVNIREICVADKNIRTKLAAVLKFHSDNFGIIDM